MSERQRANHDTALMRRTTYAPELPREAAA